MIDNNNSKTTTAKQQQQQKRNPQKTKANKKPQNQKIPNHPENKRPLFPFQGNSKPKELFSLAPSRTTADICLLWELSRAAAAAAAALLPQTGDVSEKSTVATLWSLRYCSTLCASQQEL